MKNISLTIQRAIDLANKAEEKDLAEELSKLLSRLGGQTYDEKLARWVKAQELINEYSATVVKDGKVNLSDFVILQLDRFVTNPFKQLDEEQIEALKTILNFYWDAVASDFENATDKSKHIFSTFLKLKTIL